MRVGILETGRVAEELVDRHGTYPDMFVRLLAGADPGLEFEAVKVLEGALPGSPQAADAWLVTGSKHGVYDPMPWIEPLKAFLREARGAGVPLIGICFGHQIMAEAFGGRAEKSDRGWGCGPHVYTTLQRPGWMADAPGPMRFHAMHQDQVTAIPGDATRLAESDFCPHAMLAYGDPEAPDAISIQPHPEFEPDYARDLLVARRGVAVPAPAAQAGIDAIGAPVDNAAFARWVAAYLRARAARQAA
ncbi:GMP synthase [Paralimibaculum aggregatum]|uniref:GMP synthase n=1 Tax=Paralimibaculum aggregatum TaxID=3036245 RepID=A0ABQ6LNT4_9RHOB|nr:type 1 glutamine amidotransferase [Limibaculum sp. NKW23]GMG82086.1 GMP synthase [Limibaculum sp. NKW23]